MSKPTVFISYSHKDEIWKDRLKPQLDALEMAEKIVVWDDRDIDGGDKWYPELEEAMSKAAVAVCLISENYLASKFCVKEEIPFLLSREQKNNMLFLPVLISPCSWKAFRWLKDTQMLPRDGQSIIKDFKDTWSVAFVEVSDLILQKINDPDYRVPTATIKWTAPEKDDIGRLPGTGSELFGREKELEQLDDAWESAETNIISFIAWGGVGKSTLINKWLGYMKADNYKDAEQVFAWSFYSQGTNEQVSSADAFISEALHWFGDAEPTLGSAWDKGQRLARLIRQKKTLLILDGMEPLQSSHKFERGKIHDQGLTALLRALAQNNNGLCIITSREKVENLSRNTQRVKQINLEKLSANAGRALLRIGGVKGTDQELEAAVKAFGYHALAVTLLSVYLRSIKGHHISYAQQIPDLNIPEEKGNHPRRVIEALSNRFIGKPEGDLLKMLGFFDRPADMAAIQKIIEQPVIDGLTESLCNTSEDILLKAVNRLRNENLLAKESKHRPYTLDCHPLIREHFGEQLQRQNPEAWQAAHARLYDYYKHLPDKELPDTLKEMEPLFAAVSHGCLAGKYQEALMEVYWKRIKRGNQQYSTKRLGAFGVDLSCVASFFDSLWDTPAFILTDHDKTTILNWAGMRLLALGRLSEASHPIFAAMEASQKEQDWEGAANDASLLARLYLTLGDVSIAERFGAQSVSFADRGEDSFSKGAQRTMHAYVLHQAGRFKAAEDLFKEAEAIEKQRQPENPFLYSIWGFQFCELLLSMDNHKSALERARSAIEIVTTDPLVDFGLNSLTIGKSLLLQWLETHSSNPSIILEAGLTEATEYFNRAVDGLREAGHQIFMPLALIARAIFFRHKHIFPKAWADLSEAHEIATYGQMRLHLTDYHLEAARLIQAQLVQSQSPFHIIEDGVEQELSPPAMTELFTTHVQQADTLIQETGYHCRDAELVALKKTL